MLNIEPVKIEGIDEIIKDLDPKKVTNAAKMALNTAASQTKTFISKRIRQEWNIPAAEVGKRLGVSKASKNNLRAFIYPSPASIDINVFKPTWYHQRFIGGEKKTIATGKSSKLIGKKSKFTGRSGVFVQIKKGRERHLPHAFMALGRRGGGRTRGIGVAALGTSGHWEVFRRFGPKKGKPARQRIKRKKIISINSIVQQDDLLVEVNSKAVEVFSKEFKRILRVNLSKLLDK